MTREEYKQHLLSLGIREELAEVMSRQADTFNLKPQENAHGAILSFADWDSTAEGIDFWVELLIKQDWGPKDSMPPINLHNIGPSH